VTGHFANGARLDDYEAATQKFYSVQDNIQRILNSRRNGLAHLPDYGLDDLSEIYRALALVGAPASARDRNHRAEVRAAHAGSPDGQTRLNMLRPDLDRA